MSKKIQLLAALLIIFSMVLGACSAPAVEAPAVTEAAQPVATEAPTEVPPTPVPPTATPEPAPEWGVLFKEMIDAYMPADKGSGAVAAAALSEELATQAPFLLDVREPAEIEKDGYIEGAVSIPIRDLLKNVDKLPGLDDPIVVYCASGHRGGYAFAALHLLGYTNVRNLGGGIGAWKKAELPVVTGSMPAAAEVKSQPIVENAALFTALDAYLSALPADKGFFSTKADKLAEDLTSSNPPVVIDVRSVAEWEKNGYIDGSINIPINEFMSKLDQLPAKDAAIVVTCASGHRGAVAAMALHLMGYTNVVNLGGGTNAWNAAGMPMAGVTDWAAVWGEYLAAMPDGYYTIKAADLNTALVEATPFLLDVREAAEIEKDGFIAGSVAIPVREVLKNLDKLPAKDQPIVVYCASGHRGGMVMAALQVLGYSDVKNLAGGIGAWKKAELPIEMGAPAAPVAGTAPEVDATRLGALDAFLAGLPDGFYTVKAADLQVELTGTEVPAVYDLRSDEEVAIGYIEGSVHVRIQDLLADPATLPADKAAPVVLLCQSGHRGAIGLMVMRMLGYTNVRNLAGGMNAWVAAELPVVK